MGGRALKEAEVWKGRQGWGALWKLEDKKTQVPCPKQVPKAKALPVLVKNHTAPQVAGWSDLWSPVV